MKVFVKTVILTICLVFCFQAFGQSAARVFAPLLPQPSARDVKAAAEKGDAAAQFKLGQLYYGNLDFLNAAKWYRKSAVQGNVDGQYALGTMLLSGFSKVPKEPAQGARMILLAANQNNALAQIRAGDLYTDGTIVKKDFAESYKWFSLAIKEQWAFKIKLDQVSLQMSQEEIAEGKRRAAGFKPQKPSPMLPEFKLQGITGKGKSRLAMVNGHSLAIGEDATANIDGEAYRFRCLEIGDDFTSVQVAGESHPRKLVLSSAN